MSGVRKTVAIGAKEKKHPFQDANVINALANGIKDTLFEMCSLECQFDKPFVEKTWTPIGDGTGVMQLKSVKNNGFLRIHFPKEAIFQIMSRMLGEPPKEFNDEVLDGIGEITNIVYGAMKTKAKLNPMGYEFKMASPKAEYTKDIAPLETSAKHLIIPFQVDAQKCYIEVVLISVH